MHLTMAVSLITATLVWKQYALDSEIGSRDRSSLLGKDADDF
jgi:hypothetical protein